jgi:electron transfer flavoprotein alpha subunit
MDLSYLDLLQAQEEGQVTEAEGGGGVWVVAEAQDGELLPITLESISAARLLADTLGAYVYAVLLGESVAYLAQALYQAGADGVRLADDSSLSQFDVAPYLAVLGDLFQAERPEVVLFGATQMGRELAPRIAQMLSGGLIEQVTSVTLDEATRTVQATFPAYGGEYFHIATCPEARPQVLTIKPGAFGLPFIDASRRGEPTWLQVESTAPAVRLIGPASGFEPPQPPLRQTPVIVAVGRQAQEIDAAKQLAEAMHAQLAGDMGALDAGWISPEQLVDVRGVDVAPDIYVALGIAGDTFHNAAMENAKFIVAVHPDPQAPIFGIADLCLVAEVPSVLPLLTEMMSTS